LKDHIHDGHEDGEVRDVSSNESRKKALASEVLQLDGQEEGDQTEEDAHQENVGLVVTPERFESGDNRVVGKELKKQCSIPFYDKYSRQRSMG
jgi:hypothetical protein